MHFQAMHNKQQNTKGHQGYTTKLKDINLDLLLVQRSRPPLGPMSEFVIEEKK
jgi:hypothetical protein